MAFNRIVAMQHASCNITNPQIHRRAVTLTASTDKKFGQCQSILRDGAASIYTHLMLMYAFYADIYDSLFSYTGFLVVYGNSKISFTNYSKPAPHFDIPLIELVFTVHVQDTLLYGRVVENHGWLVSTVGDGENPKSRTIRTKII